MKSANPVLRDSTFGEAAIENRENVMTIGGTVNKTLFGLLLLMASAVYTWNTPELAFNLFWPIIILTFVLLLITIFAPKASPYTVPVYCLAEGVILGGITSYANSMYPGIANQAFCLTFGILIAMLMLYKSRVIVVSNTFKSAVFSATFGIFIVYALNLVLSLFGISFMGSLFGSGWIGIAFSLFVIGIASLNLVLDFDFIEKSANEGAPKYMEWYATFGLMVTLIWLYIEILHLLMKLHSLYDGD